MSRPALPRDVAGRIAATRGGGAPLPAQARAFFEPRLGHDLGRVRIHTDDDADGLATQLGARAFTVGRDIYFGAGEYRPPGEAGRRLLAHELVHVVQQQAAGAPVRAVSQPGDPDERAADAAAARVASLEGGAAPVPIAPASLGAIVHRAVREGVTTDVLPVGQARACMVHIHGDEQTARQTGINLRATRCANFVDVTSTTRLLHDDDGGTTCTFDPNRMFTASGMASHTLKSCPRSARTRARASIVAFRDNVFIPAVARCRENAGGSLDGGLPVLALHNNTAIDITDYLPGGSERAAVETDPARTGGAANPTRVTGQNAHDFLLATDAADFAALRGTRNTVLQSNAIAAGSAADDGSLSVRLQSDRYVNLEVLMPGRRRRSAAVALATDTAMASEVLDQFGVPDQPCSPTATTTDAPPPSVPPVSPPSPAEPEAR